MSAEPELPDPDLPQDPGIPGSKSPEQLPPQDDPEVDQVSDAEQPDVDDEGTMAPSRPADQRSMSAVTRM